MKRRTFLKKSAVAASSAGVVHLGLASLLSGCNDDKTAPKTNDPLFEISLAEWSLHRMLQEEAITNLDFPVFARNRFEINAVEYVNSFFKEKARDKEYLEDLRSRCNSEGVTSLLIMCDGEGALGDEDEAARTRAVENHYRWIEAAKFLGCHSIRVNAQSSGTWDEQRDRAADGLSRLTEFGAEHEINVIVENHGGLSSNGSWLAEVMTQVDHPMCGTLPDFGNFHLGNDDWYDRYKGVAELMPFAKAVSAKSYEFGDDGSELRTDYMRMMIIVLDAGYRGFIGIEYEGDGLSEVDGILATKSLLENSRELLKVRYI